MDSLRIHNPIQSGFSMVPNALWSAPLSLEAKGIFAFLLSFRDQSTVRVALIESALSIGRDKRRRAMAELEEAGLIARRIERVAGRIVTRELVVTTVPLLREMVAGLDDEAPSDSLPPEKPSVGNSGAGGVENRPSTGGGSGPLYKTKKKKKAAPPPVRRPARPAPASPSPAMGQASAGAPLELSQLQRSRLLAGQPVLVGGQLVKPGTEHAAALVAALRDAEKGLSYAV